MIYTAPVRIPYSDIARKIEKRAQSKKFSKISRKSHQFKQRANDLALDASTDAGWWDANNNRFDDLRDTIAAMDAGVILPYGYDLLYEEYVLVGKRIGIVVTAVAVEDYDDGWSVIDGRI
jgi:hypothetical protein